MTLFTICNISLRCPQNVSVKFQLNIPQIIYYSILNIPILSESRLVLYSCMSL